MKNLNGLTRRHIPLCNIVVSKYGVAHSKEILIHSKLLSVELSSAVVVEKCVKTGNLEKEN